MWSALDLFVRHAIGGMRSIARNPRKDKGLYNLNPNGTPFGERCSCLLQSTWNRLPPVSFLSSFFAPTAVMHANPFSTRFIQPGAIEYQRFDGGSVSELAQRLLTITSKRVAIVGPHGSGKSTLVANLVAEFRSMLPETELHALRFSSEQSPRAALTASMAEWTSDSLVILDGYEQLSFWSRLLVGRSASKRGITLVATAHNHLRDFETLWETSVTETSSHWVVQQLLQQAARPEMASTLLASEDWARSREKHRQNLRESLFDMYDWYHAQSQSSSQPEA